MVLIPLIFLIIPLSLHFDMLSYLNQISSPIHEVCVDRIPPSPFSPIYQALCCGAKISSSSVHWHLFRQLGLVHLLVVSGYHLIIIERALAVVLRRFPSAFDKSFILLLPFVFLCQFQAPVVRSYMQICLGKLNNRFQFHWNSALLTLASGITCLAAFPQWMNSLSFQLSWGAGFIICFPLSGWRRGLSFYLGLYPFLIPLGPAHPLSILSNMILATLVAIPLLLFSWLTWLIPALDPIIKTGTQILITLMEQSAQWIPVPLSAQKGSLHHWEWLWLMILFGVSFTWEIYILRRSP